MNVPPSQADKHVNKTHSAGEGEEMGRAHPHPTSAPPRRSAQRHASGRARTPPRWPPSSSRPVPPGPVGVRGLPVGMLTGPFVCFVLRER